jgi:hAT family C-terminal dimerisation region
VNESPSATSKNIFDNLPALQAPKAAELRGELDRYLSTDPEHVTDALAWWYEHKHIYPRLHRMALDYLSIPGMSVLNSHFLSVSNDFSVFEPPPLTSNGYSVKDEFYFHIYATAFQFSRHGHCYVLAFGV